MLVRLTDGTSPTREVGHPYRLLGWTVLGGLGLGFFSNLANGCPLRQHVLAGQGEASAWWYLLGFYLMVLVFPLWVAPLLPLR